MTDRLYRSLDDRYIAGVAGGMAAAWNLDPALVRIAWTILAFLTGGFAVVVYIVMAIVVPEEHEAVDRFPTGATIAPDGPRRSTGPVVVGVLLVLIGFVLFVNIYLPNVRLDRLWP